MNRPIDRDLDDRPNVERMDIATLRRHLVDLSREFAEERTENRRLKREADQLRAWIKHLSPPVATPCSALLEWLNGKLADAEQSVRAREQMEQTSRSGTQKEWDEAARLAGCKPTTKRERLREAELQARCAVKARREVEMLKAAIASINRMEELHTVTTGDWESKDAFVSRVRSILFPQNSEVV